MQIRKRKELIREKMLNRRAGIPHEQKVAWDAAINRRLSQFIETHKPGVVHSFLPMKEEVNIMTTVESLYASGVKIVCPKALSGGILEHYELVDIDKMCKGVYGTRYPAGGMLYAGDMDIIIVPGLGFDTNKNRVGYGGGYYDRFLRKHNESLKVAVAYPFQIQDNIPIDKYDVPVDLVFTPEALID